MAYGDYILQTGSGIREWEEFFCRYFYRTRFEGRAPILDLGPGRCSFVKQNPRDIIGVDIEPAIVERYRQEGLDIRVGDAYAIPFPEGTFRGVFCSWLFEHLHEPDRAMAEVARVLAPGGYALIMVPSDKSLTRGFYDDYTHVRPFTKNSLNQLAQCAGMSSYRSSFLPGAKGARHILRTFGEHAAFGYFRFFDRAGRRLGFRNPISLMLEAWK